MYSHWQASWRSAAFVGALLLGYFFAMLLLASLPGLTLLAKSRLALNETLLVGVRVPIVAVAIYCGLRLSGIKTAGLLAVVAISAIYLGLSTLVQSLPMPTQMRTFELQGPSGPTGPAALMMVETSFLRVLVIPFALAFVSSFCVARTIRARAGAA